MLKVRQRQATLLKAMANPTRLQILRLLRFGGAYVCHLTIALRKRQPYISQQLSVLRNAGLVTDERQGLNIFYRLADERIGELLDGLDALAPRVADVATLRALQGPMAGCSCPHCTRELGVDEAQVCHPLEVMDQIA